MFLLMAPAILHMHNLLRHKTVKRETIGWPEPVPLGAMASEIQ